jgi:hypothetical protein
MTSPFQQADAVVDTAVDHLRQRRQRVVEILSRDDGAQISPVPNELRALFADLHADLQELFEELMSPRRLWR